MINIIQIDVDTKRERQIIFSKPPNIKEPVTREEAREMILTDIICVSNALKMLIVLATKNNYAINSELIDGVVKTINEAIIPPITNES